MLPSSAGSHPLPSFAVGGRYYVHGKRVGDVGRLYAAPIAGDGSLGPWEVATDDHGGGEDGFAAIVTGGNAYHFRNGHIARYPLTDDGLMDGDAELLEDDMNTSFGGNRYVWDSAAVIETDTKSFVFHLGGYSFADDTIHREIYRSATPLGGSFEATESMHPALRPGKAAFVRSGQGGFLFTADAEAKSLWRAPVDAGGAIGAWTEVQAPTQSGRGDLFAVDSTLFAVRGAKVWAAAVDSEGALGEYSAMPDLPSGQMTMDWNQSYAEGAAYAIVGSHVYLTGSERVYYAALETGDCGD